MQIKVKAIASKHRINEIKPAEVELIYNSKWSIRWQIGHKNSSMFLLFICVQCFVVRTYKMLSFTIL